MDVSKIFVLAKNAVITTLMNMIATKRKSTHFFFDIWVVVSQKGDLLVEKIDDLTILVDSFLHCFVLDLNLALTFLDLLNKTVHIVIFIFYGPINLNVLFHVDYLQFLENLFLLKLVFLTFTFNFSVFLTCLIDLLVQFLVFCIVVPDFFFECLIFFF